MCRSGGMVDTASSNLAAERREGSNPFCGTIFSHMHDYVKNPLFSLS
jgi:hypothetical protein